MFPIRRFNVYRILARFNFNGILGMLPFCHLLQVEVVCPNRKGAQSCRRETEEVHLLPGVPGPSCRIFLKTGSHFVTHADWGCRDGEHKAWIIIEVDNKEEARRILPPAFRSLAKIVSLNKFSMEEIDDIFRQHQG